MTGLSNNVLLIIIIALLISAVVLIIVLAAKKRKTSSLGNVEQGQKEQRQLSYKQQMYLNALRGDETSPYSVASYIISQSAYDAFSDFIKEVFGHEKGSEESNRKIYLMIKRGRDSNGSFKVLPDGDKDITFPRTNTSFLDRSHDFDLKEFMTIDENHVVFFFNNSKNTLSKLLKLYFKNKNIEIVHISRIKPFTSQTNCYVVLDINSEEMAMVYYLIRVYTKDRDSLGLKRHDFPSQKSINQFKTKAMKDYHLKNEYEFMRYLIAYFVLCELEARTFFFTNLPKIQAIRDVFNNNPGYDRSVLRYYRSIEKELLKELEQK